MTAAGDGEDAIGLHDVWETHRASPRVGASAREHSCTAGIYVHVENELLQIPCFSLILARTCLGLDIGSRQIIPVKYHVTGVCHDWRVS